MTASRATLALVAAGFLLAGGGLGYALGASRGEGASGTASQSGAPSSPVVAVFQGGAITVEDVRARIRAEGPMLREQYASREGQLALVEQMVRERLVLLDARRKRYDVDPLVTRQCEAAITELYLERELEEPLRQRPITDDELRASFEENQEQYARPERVRLARLLLAAPADDPEARAKQKQAASALLKELAAALRKDPGAFGAVARRRSADPRTRPLGGELPMLTDAEVRQSLSPPVADAVFATPRPEGLLPHPVESPEGFEILQVLDREQAAAPSFDLAREQIRSRLARERRESRHREIIEVLARQANVQLRPESLAGLMP
jgi:hypothetical protein